MASMRQRLRRAAKDFADALFELLHSRARAAPNGTRERSSPTRRRAARGDSHERVLIYVTEHPGCAPKAIAEATKLARPTVQAALARACSEGALVKTGRVRSVAYAPAGTSAGASKRRAPRTGARRSPIGAADALEPVVAWIEAHPGCGRGALSEAFDLTIGVLRGALDLARADGRIRMEGTRRSARYFARTRGAA